MQTLDRQRNYKRNGDIISNAGSSHLMSENIFGYKQFDEEVSASNWYYDFQGGILYYIENQNEYLDSLHVFQQVIGDYDAVRLNYSPYTYIRINSTPEELYATYPNEGIEVGSNPLFEIDGGDDGTGNFIINDERIE